MKKAGVSSVHSHSNQRLPSSFSSCILLSILVQATTLPEEAGAQSLADPDLHAAIIELAKLERVSEQNCDKEGNEKSTNQSAVGSGGDPAHLQLFYGGTGSACAMDQDTTGTPSDVSQPAP
jgi:hypothetical protein